MLASFHAAHDPPFLCPVVQWRQTFVIIVSSRARWRSILTISSLASMSLFVVRLSCQHTLSCLLQWIMYLQIDWAGRFYLFVCQVSLVSSMPDSFSHGVCFPNWPDRVSKFRRSKNGIWSCGVEALWSPHTMVLRHFGGSCWDYGSSALTVSIFEWRGENKTQRKLDEYLSFLTCERFLTVMLINDLELLRHTPLSQDKGIPGFAHGADFIFQYPCESWCLEFWSRVSGALV